MLSKLCTFENTYLSKLMKKGAIGIFSKEIFDPKSKLFIDERCAYLTVGRDISDEYKKNFSTDKKVFEAEWYMLDADAEVVCTAIYLSESIVPDRVYSPGNDFKMSVENRDWEYFKVALFINEHTQVVYLHEKSMKLFIWTDT